MNGQIGGEAAVPVGDTVDHHGVVHVGQAGRGEQGVDRQLLAREDAHLAGLHVGGGDEGLDLAAAAHGFFVEMPTQHLAQRVELQWIALPWRERALDQVGPQRARRIVEVPVALQAVERRALDGARDRHRAELGPEGGERCARAQAAALQGEIDALGRIHAAILHSASALRSSSCNKRTASGGVIMVKGGAERAWRKRPSTILWMLSFGQLISWGLVYYTFPLFVVPMTQELGWSRSPMFGALSAGLLVAGLCSIPVGAWIDRGHGRMLMTGGSLLAAALLMVWSRVGSLPMFYALWIGLGACQAVILYEPAFAVITRVYGPRYRQAILLMTFLGGLASTFGIPFAQLLIERIGWRPTLEVMAAINLGVAFLIHWLFIPGPHEKAVPIAEVKPHAAGTQKKSPLAAAVRVPAFWGLVVAFAGYGLAFSAMSFHLIPLLDDRHVPIGVVMAIIALIGPMQVVGRVLLMVGQRHITTIQLGALIYFAFPISMAMLAAGISDVYGLILFAIIYGVANGLVTILRGMAVPEFIGPEGYGVVSGALTMPTNIMRAAGPLLASLAWAAFGGYTPVLWGLAGIMLIAAIGFAAAALLSKRQQS